MQPTDRDDIPEEKRKRESSSADEHWRALPATPQRLATLFQQFGFSPLAWKTAQKRAGMIPTRAEWIRFVDILLAGLGTIFLLAGILFFFAFNWDDMSRWARFATVEGAVIMATVCAFIFKLDTWAGRLALGSAALLLGVALAVVGQEYQTGADSWRLFQVWLFMITGWVLISRWNILYLMWMVLLNVTVSLYWTQVIDADWMTLNLILLVANACFVFLWDAIAHWRQYDFMQEGRWFLYIVMVIALSHGTTLMVDYIFELDFVAYQNPLAIPIYGILLAVTFVAYTQLKRDLLMVAFSALSLLVVSIAFFGELFLIEDDWSLGGATAYFFAMTLVTVGLTTGVVWVLRRIQTSWEVSS